MRAMKGIKKSPSNYNRVVQAAIKVKVIFIHKLILFFVKIFKIPYVHIDGVF